MYANRLREIPGPQTTARRRNGDSVAKFVHHADVEQALHDRALLKKFLSGSNVS